MPAHRTPERSPAPPAHDRTPAPARTPDDAGNRTLPEVNEVGSGEGAWPGRNSGRESDETRRTEN